MQRSSQLRAQVKISVTLFSARFRRSHSNFFASNHRHPALPILSPFFLSTHGMRSQEETQPVFVERGKKPSSSPSSCHAEVPFLGVRHGSYDVLIRLQPGPAKPPRSFPSSPLFNDHVHHEATSSPSIPRFVQRFTHFKRETRSWTGRRL